MSSSVGISFPLTIKLPETPSSTGTSSQIKLKPQEISISSSYPVTSLTELLRDAADKNSLQKTKSIHGIVTKSHFTSKSLTLLLNQMVIAYSKTSDFGSARQVFDEIPHKSVFSWTVLIVGATENGFHRDGFGYFVVIRGFSSLTFVNTSLLSVYAKLGRVGDSRKVFSSMESRNEVSWNAMISGFVSNGFYSEAYSSFSGCGGRCCCSLECRKRTRSHGQRL
ncbi:BnaC07g31320D [Brassica napus]|uniref:BnaC07g31320D protein n=1 Tax=Brassica napus TaxID=3708 RepID=A0A078G9G5_BRANA|nr:BnaC07g31320D [Brassica napus]